MTDQMRNPSSASSSASPSVSHPSPPPVRCVRGCGFWGNPRTENMCSVCHRRHTEDLRKAAAAVAIADDASSTASAADSSSTSDVATTITCSIETADVVATATTSIVAVDTTSDNNNNNEVSLLDATLTSDSLPSATLTTSILPAAPACSPASTTSDLPTLLDTSALYSVAISTHAEPELDSTDAFASSTSSSASVSSSPSASVDISSSLDSASSSASSSSASAAASVVAAADKKRKNRCAFCSKKVGLTFFACRCDDQAMFCATHRYPHAHNCSHNHRNDQQSKILKANPVVKTDKFEKM